MEEVEIKKRRERERKEEYISNRYTSGGFHQVWKGIGLGKMKRLIEWRLKKKETKTRRETKHPRKSTTHHRPLAQRLEPSRARVAIHKESLIAFKLPR